MTDPPGGPLPLLFVDETVAVVAKPSGMPVHRGWADDRVTVASLARTLLGTGVHPLHRLDRATSGALVIARNSDAARRLASSLAAGDVERRYLALVRGVPSESGEIDATLRRRKDSDASDRVPALTRYRRLWVFENRYSLVEARPVTGRFHQIRRHMKSISCHLVGDVLYGKGLHNRRFRDDFGLHRLALHALSVRFPHPLTGEGIRVVAPLPDDLAAPFARMGVPGELLEPAG